MAGRTWESWQLRPEGLKLLPVPPLQCPDIRAQQQEVEAIFVGFGFLSVGDQDPDFLPVAFGGGNDGIDRLEEDGLSVLCGRIAEEGESEVVGADEDGV